MKSPIGRALRRVAREVVAPLAQLLAALLFLWEEVLWVTFGRVMARFGRLPPVARVEAAIRALPPYPALALFLVPLALTYPPKLLAFWLMATGHWWFGFALFAVLEVLAAAILARVYILCRPSLHTLAWFAWSEATLLRWSKWAHEMLHHYSMRGAASEPGGDDAHPAD